MEKIKLNMKIKEKNFLNKKVKTNSIPIYIPIIIFIFIIIIIMVHNLNTEVDANSNGNIDKDMNKENMQQNELEKDKSENENVLTITLEKEKTNEENVEDNKDENINENSNDDNKNESQINTNKNNSDTNKAPTYTIVNGKQYEMIGTLNIPSLGIEYPILPETSTQLLKVSLNKFWGANPNEVGNMVIVGHNYKNNNFFGNLSKINIGEIIKITDLTGKTLDYKVYATDIVDPTDTRCTSQLTNGHTEITLVTCYYENGNAHATKRFIVKARAD